MNFCLQDAFNLGWKLAHVVKGLADERTLDSYDSERLPVMHALLESVKAQCVLQFNFGPEGVALKRRMSEHFIPLPDVQRKLVRELSGLEAPYPSAPGSHPLTGERCPDADVTMRDGHSMHVTELLRDRQFVLLDLEGYSRQFDALAVAGRPLVVHRVRLGRVPPELDGVKALLVRPDGYVAWASTDVGRLAEAEAEINTWLRP